MGSEDQFYTPELQLLGEAPVKLRVGDVRDHSITLELVTSVVIPAGCTVEFDVYGTP